MNIINIFEAISLVLIGSTISAIFGFVFSKFLQQRLPKSYSIGVVGFPKSGKTTLITSIFGELFAKRILGISIIPRGEETRKRINNDLASLEMGKALGPTTDQDLFAYRVDMVFGKGILSRRYKVEIGDFPGEDTTDFAEKYGDWIHETPFFKWVMEADSFIFIIDIAPILIPKKDIEYIAKMSKSIRTAWQKLLEYHYEGKKAIHNKPLILAFTKSDLLCKDNKIRKTKNITLENKIMVLGFGENVPIRKEIDSDYFDHKAREIVNKFKDLIRYLKSESRLFNIVFVSSFGYFKEKGASSRIGIPELINFILPKSKY